MPSFIRTLLEPEEKDPGGFKVWRILPHEVQQMVGPFIFFDHLGPAVFPSGKGVDVRPHPHIGLATVTYLFEGVLMHRDSLDSVQEIHPGAVNWMTAGHGIVHSERTPDSVCTQEATLHGIQTWVALPFVSSRPARIEQAKLDWHHQQFAKVPLDMEFIPLPENIL